jgi:C-terminal processing protease CtpA/Prc
MFHCCTTACDKTGLPGAEKVKSAEPVSCRAEVPLKLPMDEEAVDTAVELGDSKLANDSMMLAEGSIKFKFHMARSTKTTKWGVDFAADSGQSLTMVSLEPGQAMAQSNDSARTYAAQPLKPGDVIVSIDGEATQGAMVEKLKKGVSLTADIVRYSKFDAVIERNETAGEPLGMDVVRSNGKLVIDKIDLNPGPIKRYNAKNYLKPLVKGDVIVAVDSKDTCDDMMMKINSAAKFTLRIERRQELGPKKTTDMNERVKEPMGEIAMAA